jgi:hypothetical protein
MQCPIHCKPSLVWPPHEHKEVLGTVLCVCCRHCQGELFKAHNIIYRLAESLKVVHEGYLADPGSEFNWDIWGNEAEKSIKEADIYLEGLK